MAERKTLWQVTESLGHVQPALAVSETIPDVVTGSSPVPATKKE